MLVVKSKVKDVVSGQNVSGDFAEALNEMLVWSVGQACARAEANGRKTVGARDL
jgi:histone H3/H4